jgi:hypothetical protein
MGSTAPTTTTDKQIPKSLDILMVRSMEVARGPKRRDQAKDRNRGDERNK